MAQTKNGPNEASPNIHDHVKKTQEENQEEYQVHQDTGDNPHRRITNRKIGDMLQLSLHQDHQYPTKHRNQPHRPITSHTL